MNELKKQQNAESIKLKDEISSLIRVIEGHNNQKGGPLLVSQIFELNTKKAIDALSLEVERLR